ncbi:MAG: DUF3516 domain-containing protein [Polyangiaceae bacterium]
MIRTHGPPSAWRRRFGPLPRKARSARIRGARSQKTLVEKTPDGTLWRVQQILTDPDDDNDCMVTADIDLERSAAARKPVLAVREIRS